MASKKPLEQIESLIHEASRVLTDSDLKALDPNADVAEQLRAKLRPLHLERHPFSQLAPDDLDRPDLSLLRVLRNPDYFGYTCHSLLSLNGVDPLDILPIHAVTMSELWWRQFPMLVCTRGFGKSTYLSISLLLKLLFRQGTRAVVIGRALRQAIQLFETMERIWWNSPILRDLVGTDKLGKKNGPHREIDRREFVIGDSIATFLPLGNGETIRGFRGNVVITDEFGSVDENIYGTVVQGFGAVAADPVNKARHKANERILKVLGLWTENMDELESSYNYGNQSILAGTATVAFNHFCRYWKEYKDIIQSGGDPERLREVLKGEPPPGFDWRGYSILRVPYEMVPEGYMDAATVARARATSSTAVYNCEYGASFMADTDGFFRQSVIERATVGTELAGPIEFPSCGPVDFTPSPIALPGRSYVIGVDPAMKKDNFSVVVVECWPDHRRVVYCWSTSGDDHSNRKRHHKIESDYWRFCARRIREIYHNFQATKILMDAGGGGLTIQEALSDPDKLGAGELPIYLIKNERKPNDTDRLPGHHILEMVQFRDNDWVKEANWGLRKDLESRFLLFPRIDEVAYALAAAEDRLEKSQKDGREELLLEIEKLKEELTLIQHSSTTSGMERWDTPDKKTNPNQKGILKKDRYSALLMANMGARLTMNASPAGFMWSRGGFAHSLGYGTTAPQMQSQSNYQGTRGGKVIHRR